MATVKRYFDGLQNGDSADFAVAPNEYINCENFRFGPNGSGKFDRLEAIESTILIRNPYLPVTGKNLALGSVADLEYNRIIQFNYNSGGDHGIYSYEGGTWYKVLLTADVEGGLNFNPLFLIHSANVLDGLLYWVEGLNNEPRKINVASGIKLYHSSYDTDAVPYDTPLLYTTITLIKRPPIYPLGVLKIADENFPNNYTANKAFLFTYRYKYRDHETSALSAYSALVPYNTAIETFNGVRVTISLDEVIDDEVQTIELCAKYGNTGVTKVVQRFDKDTPADAAAIALHNAGTTALTFDFFNDRQYLLLDAVASVNNFDDIALRYKAQCAAANRLFLGNSIKGYNTPATSSLAVTLVTDEPGTPGTYTGKWGYVILHANFLPPEPPQDSYMFPFIELDPGQGAPNTLYYFPSARSGTIWNGGTAPTMPATINTSLATFTGTTEAALVNFLKNQFNFQIPPNDGQVGFPKWKEAYEILYNWYQWSATPVTIVNNHTIPGSNVAFFKSGGTYFANIAFFDRYRRKCGVIKAAVKFQVPERTFAQTTFGNTGTWVLDNTNALNEIPDWAFYYQIHITKNQVTEFFFQSWAMGKPAVSGGAGVHFGVTYVTKDQDGTFNYDIGTYTNTTYALGIDISSILGFGYGYVFTEDDHIKVYKPIGQGATVETYYSAQIIGQDGNYVHVKPGNIGTLDENIDVLFEIYTPHRELDKEPFYEQGPVYDVLTPGTATRSYSVVTGTLNGDTYNLQRVNGIIASYLVEAMSPNDQMWRTWQTDTGWVNYVDTIGQQRKTNTIDFTDTFIKGTKVNNVNKFQVLNVAQIPAECGEILKLAILSKVQGQQGNIMLSICHRATASMYLGETQLVASSENAFVATSAGVVGTINNMKKSYGTIHPESFSIHDGDGYWVDVLNGKVVQYAANGLTAVSDYGDSRYWKLFSDQYNTMTAASLAKLNGRQAIPGGFDDYNKEYLACVPQTLELPLKGDLFDYDTGIDYPYDVWDGKAKVRVFKPERNKFQGSYTYTVDCFITLNNILYSFSNGKMYSHNDYSTACNFHGDQYAARLMYAENQSDVSTVKVFKSLAVEALKAPDFTHIRTEKPWIQSSDIAKEEWTDNEGNFYAPVKRDRLTPRFAANNNAEYIRALTSGDKMRGNTVLVMLEYNCLQLTSEDQVTNDLPWIKFVDAEFELSKGQKVQVSSS